MKNDEKYKAFRDGTPAFTERAAFQAGRTLMGNRRSGSKQPAESLKTQYASGNYFSMFGISAYAGRAFPAEDDRKGAEPVVMMSHATWQQKLGNDPSVVGANFMFNGRAFTVIGVAPPGFYAVLSVAALVATVLPARKAATLEPIRALRPE